MKLIQLNTWAGMVYKPLIKFIKENNDTDIFCFQEVTNGEELAEHVKTGNKELLKNLTKILPKYSFYYSPLITNEVGLTIFIKKEIKVEKFSENFVFRWYNAQVDKDISTIGRCAQLIEFKHNKNIYSVLNFHGLWNGKGKWDTKDRLLQSKNLKKVMNQAKGKVILCGDFNLMPETKSIKILEKGMRNLIMDYKIKDTRGELYKKELRFADYILVSPNVKVLDFKVLPESVSDHLPLYLEFE